MGYFDIAGSSDLLTLYGRAKGTFKDPNVYGTFVVLPFVMLVQGFFTGTHRRPLIAGGALFIIAFGLFLSFSRGAWAVAAAAAMLCALLTFVTSTSNLQRIRMVAIAIAGVALFIAILTVALQFESIRSTFEVRATLDQSYDQGETGRFGNQRRSIPLLLELPNGFGPLQFREYFPEDPHNTFLNAFASYGWLGGLCYLGLIASTLVVGWSLVFAERRGSRNRSRSGRRCSSSSCRGYRSTPTIGGTSTCCSASPGG